MSDFDAEKFGAAMGELIQEAVGKASAELKSAIAELRNDVDGWLSEAKSATAEKVEAIERRLSEAVAGADALPDLVSKSVAEAVASLPKPADGADGKDCDMDQVEKRLKELVSAIPVVHGKDGQDGAAGEKGEPGKDGIGIAGHMIDRAGHLVVTTSAGEVKDLGPVVGRDGKDGADGKDGIGLEDFELAYHEDTHEVEIVAKCAGRTKSLRYYAGGIHYKGYFRDGMTAKAGEAFTCDGSLWVAQTKTAKRPGLGDEWSMVARKGRDGASAEKAVKESGPIKLGGK